MRTTTTLTLLAAVLLLGGYIFVVERKADQQDQRQEKARRALRFDPAQVTGLRIATPTVQMALEKDGPGWQMISPVKARANAGEVTRILDELESLVRSDIITGRQQREQNLTPSDFGFAQPRARITLLENGQDMTLLVGREAPLGGTMFLKLETEKSIFVASTNLLSALPQSPAALRERRIFLGPPAECDRLEIRRPDGLLQVTRTDQGAWRVQKPFVGRAAYAAVQGLLDQLTEIRAIDFVAESIAAASLYGLDEPAAQVTLAGTRAYGDQILRIGRTVEGRTNEVYATQEGSESVFTVDAGLLKTLGLKAAELRDRRLLTLSAYDIGFIRTVEGERTISLVRGEDGVWAVQEPRQFKADDHKVQALLSEWTGLRIETFIDNPGTNLVQWGLNNPARRITFARRPPTEPAGTSPSPSPDDSITVWVAREENPNRSLALVKRVDEEPLYRVTRDGLSALPMQPLYYRDPVVLTVHPDEVRSLTRLIDGREQMVDRATPTNVFKAATGAQVDESAVQLVLTALQQVEAVDYVAEDPESLAMWGLEAPRATLTLGLTGQGAIGKSLILGEEAGPDAVFAMVRGQGLVFTLSRTLCDTLLIPLYANPPESAPLVEPTPNHDAPAPSEPGR